MTFGHTTKLICFLRLFGGGGETSLASGKRTGGGPYCDIILFYFHCYFGKGRYGFSILTSVQTRFIIMSAKLFAGIFHMLWIDFKKLWQNA